MGEDPPLLVKHRPVGAEEVQAGEEGAARKKGLHPLGDAPHRRLRPDHQGGLGVRRQAPGGEPGVDLFPQVPQGLLQGVDVPLDQEGHPVAPGPGQGEEPEEGPEGQGPGAEAGPPQGQGQEENQEGEEVDPAPGGQNPPWRLHQGVAQKPPGKGQLPLLREPLQDHPPPHPGQGRGGEGEEEAEGEGLDQDQGHEGGHPPGPEQGPEALGEPNQVESPEPHPRPEPGPEPAP
ncbi:hypothetical protein THFILI_08740 [Thermus filiformis]|uniref:Uncharacterized protein n=1 Tax=Thermus filiformis TaxID=276 RepID=A0A0D6XAG8_THEFI|nr:hypothetical protein THFILI_08740 [Thermus filiformis]